MSGSDLHHRLGEALREVEQLRAENERLRTLLSLSQQTQTILDARKPEQPPVDARGPASTDEKIALVRRLFRGRDDVYAARWESTRTGKSGYTPAVAGGWSRHGPKTYLPVSDEAIERHLRGRESIGVYPLLTDDSCWFLACDLDGRIGRGSSTRSRSSRPLTSTECRLHWNEAAPAVALMFGSSSPLRCRRRPRAGSGRCCCAPR